MKQDRLCSVVGKIGEKTNQYTVIVKANNQAQTKKGDLAARSVADDGKIGCKPVGAAYKQDGVDWNDNVCSER